jgi:hypothetical protein
MGIEVELGDPHVVYRCDEKHLAKSGTNFEIVFDCFEFHNLFGCFLLKS